MKHVLRTTNLVVLAALAMLSTASQATETQPKTKSGPQLALSGAGARPISMVGTWIVRDAQHARPTIKMVFRSNGTFDFLGAGFRSAGKFKVQEHKLHLEWTSVDGAKVAPGTMKKGFPMAEDNSSFAIDKYTYFKSGVKG
jgi:hypothetical protein